MSDANDDDDTRLPRRIRELIGSGQLPSRYPDRVWGGPGSGRELCVLCRALLPSSEIVIEAEFMGGETPSRRFFHRDCFWVIESEWPRASTPPDTSEDAAAPGVDAQIEPRRRSG